MTVTGRTSTITASLCLVLLHMGCSSEAGPGGASDDGRPVTWVVSEEPSVTIGGADERPGYLIEGVTDVTRLSDGRIALLDGGAAELRIYTAGGEHVRTDGGEGEGPGELLYPSDLLRLAGDTLLVTATRHGFTWYDPDAGFVRVDRFPVWDVTRHPCRIGEGGWEVVAGPRFLMVLDDNFYGEECPRHPGGVHRVTALVALGTKGEEALDTLAILPSTERNSPNYRVYGAMVVVAADGERAWAADTRGDSIFAFDLASGARSGAVPTPFEARPIPPEAKAHDVRRWERDGEEVVGNPYVYPETYPRIARILVDELGLLWVMQYPQQTDPLVPSYSYTRASSFRPPAEGWRWRVVDPAVGRVVAEVTTPAGFFPVEIGSSWMLGVGKDELDRHSVRLHELAR